jgi:DNA phosphorothioation-associated putative methyltransferase
MSKAVAKPEVSSVARHRTAITRVSLSRPVRLALDAGLIDSDTTFLDYGCGRGDDLRSLQGIVSACYGWDPVHRPQGELHEAHVVNIGYVVNVIEHRAERREALCDAWQYAERVLIVSARLDHESKGAQLTQHGDGFLTGSGTFQKFFNQHELSEWIDTTLGVNSVAAGPGVFFVFRDEALRESFAASRFRRRAVIPDQRISDILFEKYRELFQPLMGFYASRGRLPTHSELADAAQIIDAFGSLHRAFAVVRRVTGPGQWDQIEQEKAQDLLVYVALSRFGGRPRFSSLSDDMQLDIKALFRTYNRACEQADQLLFSAGDMDAVSRACDETMCGKVTREALYVHVDALPSLAPILRVHEGCARAYLGSVDGANVIKLNRQRPQIS